MFLIAGLGNPTEKYENTRHNVGFMAVDYVYQKLSQTMSVKTPWKQCKITESHRSVLTSSEIEIMFIKPLTFMNLSGVAVKKALSRFKIPAENLIVLQDDIDIFFGKVKYQKNRSHAGHNGIKSIIENIKTKDFSRVRIGILPENIEKQKIDTKKFVLKKFTKKEITELENNIFPDIHAHLQTMLKTN